MRNVSFPHCFFFNFIIFAVVSLDVWNSSNKKKKLVIDCSGLFYDMAMVKDNTFFAF